ncbi:hypothetical protein, partial [Pseudomonas sp.]
TRSVTGCIPTRSVGTIIHTLMHKPVRPMKLKTAMSHLLGRP